VFTTTKDRALLTTTTGALPRPSWYTENLRGIPLSQGFSRLAYREQHFDCLACHVAAQHRAGIDIFVDGTNIVRKELGIEEAYIPATDKQLSMVPLSA
jgi:5-methyltetrahydropteroyltriglutamate--homocysteine methyltransferase